MGFKFKIEDYFLPVSFLTFHSLLFFVFFLLLLLFWKSLIEQSLNLVTVVMS